MRITAKIKLKHGEIYEALKARGMTQKQGAAFVGVSQNTFNGWLNLGSVPKVLNELQAANLEELVGMPIEEIWPERFREKDWLELPKSLAVTKEVSSIPYWKVTPKAIAYSIDIKGLPELLRKMINVPSITKRQREIFIERVFNGLSCAEVAAKFGLSRQSVDQTVHKVINMLRHPHNRKTLEEFREE